MSRIGLLLLLLGAGLVAALVAAARPAHATFPGTNGRIAFVSNGAGNFDIYTMNPDGSGIVNVTNDPSSDSQPDYSPDATKIAFRSDRTGDREIDTMNADGTALTRLTFNLAGDTEPAWSPDGSLIAFASNRSDPNFATCDQTGTCNYDIFVMRADGSRLRQLTFDTGDDEWPQFSPDGNLVAFSTNVGGAYAVYTVELRTLAVHKLTTDSLGAGQPDWSPDGTKITFVNNICAGCPKSDIFVMNADGGGVTQLTHSFGNNLDPTWSPQGDKITFTHGNNLQFNREQIYIINPDGTGITRVTHNNDDNFAPDWGSG